MNVREIVRMSTEELRNAAQSTVESQYRLVSEPLGMRYVSAAQLNEAIGANDCTPQCMFAFWDDSGNLWNFVWKEGDEKPNVLETL